jgi:hypothetical protein
VSNNNLSLKIHSVNAKTVTHSLPQTLKASQKLASTLMNAEVRTSVRNTPSASTESVVTIATATLAMLETATSVKKNASEVTLGMMQQLLTTGIRLDKRLAMIAPRTLTARKEIASANKDSTETVATAE